MIESIVATISNGDLMKKFSRMTKLLLLISLGLSYIVTIYLFCEICSYLGHYIIGGILTYFNHSIWKSMLPIIVATLITVWLVLYLFRPMLNICLLFFMLIIRIILEVRNLFPSRQANIDN